MPLMGELKKLKSRGKKNVNLMEQQRMLGCEYRGKLEKIKMQGAKEKEERLIVFRECYFRFKIKKNTYLYLYF
jgi:hypothetical protein